MECGGSPPPSAGPACRDVLPAVSSRLGSGAASLARMQREQAPALHMSSLVAHSWFAERHLRISAFYELVAVDDEFRIRAGAEFVEVHALALALGGDAMRGNTADQPVQSVGER